jgi:SRSO17 transposase
VPLSWFYRGYANPLKRLHASESVDLYKCLILLDSCRIHATKRLTTIPPDMPFDRLVDLAKLRWRIERDYQELKQELGLGHYEGRGWRGFHHHATCASPPMPS